MEIGAAELNISDASYSRKNTTAAFTSFSLSLVVVVCTGDSKRNYIVFKSTRAGQLRTIPPVTDACAIGLAERAVPCRWLKQNKTCDYYKSSGRRIMSITRG